MPPSPHIHPLPRLLLATASALYTLSAPAQSPQQTADQLDATTWQAEVAAAPFTRVITDFWDTLTRAPDPLAALAAAPLASLSLPSTQNPPTPVAPGITRTDYNTSAWTTHLNKDFKKVLRAYTLDGWKINDTSWHHTTFRPNSDASPPSSRVTFEIAASQPLQDVRLLLRGDLDIDWSGSTPPVATSAQVSRLTVLKADGPPPFLPYMNIGPPNNRTATHYMIAPVIVTDVDGDGRSEIINSGTNTILFNLGNGEFDSKRLSQHPVFGSRPGLVADFTGDAKPDFLVASSTAGLLLFDGTGGIPFTDPASVPWDGPELPSVSVITAGDIDGDGDLDLWIGQLKPPYTDGNFPTPYYDATDGHPSFLLLNDGTGTFTDNTVAAGLAFKHRRRVSSASLVDLDADGDLDLLTVSDFAGLDAYKNDGSGHFTDASEITFPASDMFGMGHTTADFDHDGLLDIFALGRSSHAADRIAALGAGGPQGFPEHNRMRAPMAAGNHLFLATPAGTFTDSQNTSAIAKTGWPWDTTSFDFDNDGDLEIYIANGYVTGKSSRDYGSNFWRHDIYLGKSLPTPELEEFFRTRLLELASGEMSWSGQQANVFAIDSGGGNFVDIGFLVGISHPSDSRATIAEDFDNNGTIDLAVLDERWLNSRTQLHQSLAIYLNNLETTNHWIAVSLFSDVPGISTIGATITATIDGKTPTHHVVTGDGYRCQSPAVAHFGLGKSTAVDSVTVRWPGGKTTVLTNPEIDTRHVVRPPR